MDVFTGFHGHVLAAVQQLKHDGVVPKDASVDGISLGAPKDPTHGDLATNAAMVLAKPAKLAPRVLAERIVPLLASDPYIEKVDIAGPGFVNDVREVADPPRRAEDSRRGIADTGRRERAGRSARLPGVPATARQQARGQ